MTDIATFGRVFCGCWNDRGPAVGPYTNYYDHTNLNVSSRLYFHTNNNLFRLS